MTIFNTVQLPAFDGAVKATQPAAPQLSIPDDEAIRFFQQAYERPSETSRTTERPSELPPATPETLAKVVTENLTLAKELPKPVAVLQVVEKPAVAAQPVAVERSVAAERPTELPPATPETLAKVVMENLTLATDLPKPVELPGKLTVTTPVREGADGTVERPTAPVPEIPVALERPAELPPATPETLAKVVTENLTLAKELPKPVAVLQVAEKPAVAAQPVAVARSVAAEHPAELPPATPETLAKVAAENLTLAKELPQPVELPQVVEKPVAIEKPVAVERPAELPPATVETLAKVVEENLTLAKDLPQPVEVPQVVEKPVAIEKPVAVERPAELPVATPETLAKVVEENLTLAKDLPQPVEVPQAVVMPTAVEQPVGVEKATVVEKPVAVEQLVAAERPEELPPATAETLARVVEENLILAKDLPQPVEVPGKPTVTTPVREGADGRVEMAGEPESRKMPEVADDADTAPQGLPETVAGAAPAVTPAVSAPEAAPVAGVAAKVSAEMPRTASSVVIEAASAVADTLLVTPNLMRGDGEIRVQLKPDVLDGAQICIKVMGKSMQVEFASVTDDVARLMTEAQPQLVQRLTEKIPTFEVAVTVLPGNAAGRRLARKGVGHLGGEA